MGWEGKSTVHRKWEDAAKTTFVGDKGGCGLCIDTETDHQPFMRLELNSTSTFCCRGPPMDHLCSGNRLAILQSALALKISCSPIKTIFSPHPGASSLLSPTHLLFAGGGRLFGGHTRLGIRGLLYLVLPSYLLRAIQQRGTGTWEQGLRRCQKDFAAHLDCPSSVFRGGEGTALAQPRQNL